MCPNPRNRNKLFVRCNIILRIRNHTTRRKDNPTISTPTTHTHIKYNRRKHTIIIHRNCTIAIPRVIPPPMARSPNSRSASHRTRARTVVDPQREVSSQTAHSSVDCASPSTRGRPNRARASSPSVAQCRAWNFHPRAPRTNSNARCVITETLSMSIASAIDRCRVRFDSMSCQGRFRCSGY